MPDKDNSLESWIWDAACSIRGAQEAPKFKDFILPLIFTKRLCDVFDDELNRIAREVGSRIINPPPKTAHNTRPRQPYCKASDGTLAPRHTPPWLSTLDSQISTLQNLP
jgi:type I restriction-modification system DNA methylase subunit